MDLRWGAAFPAVSPPAEDVDRLVRGEHQGANLAADPALVFAGVVLLDLDQTASVLMSMAREARERRITGTHGFRPSCRVLRQ